MRMRRVREVRRVRRMRRIRSEMEVENMNSNMRAAPEPHTLRTPWLINYID